MTAVMVCRTGGMLNSVPMCRGDLGISVSELRQSGITLVSIRP